MNPKPNLIEDLFDYVEVNSDYLRKIIKEVLLIISRHTNINELSFGPLMERRTYSKEAGEVTEDGWIILDSEILRKYDDDISKAIIAHELAHYYLGHYLRTPYTLEYEYEADEIAQKWGFAIDKFRAVCGPPTLE
jgi:hypothetical protein